MMPSFAKYRIPVSGPGHTQNPNILSMKGGKYHVPTHEYNKFLDDCAKFYDNNGYLSFSERSLKENTIFRIDIDIKLKKPEEYPDLIFEAIRVVFKCIRNAENFEEIYSKHGLKLYVLDKPIREIKKGASKFHKIGIHIFGNFMLSNTDHKLFFVPKLNECINNIIGDNIMEDAVDNSIYSPGKGLLLYGDCKGEDDIPYKLSAKYSLLREDGKFIGSEPKVYIKPSTKKYIRKFSQYQIYSKFNNLYKFSIPEVVVKQPQEYHSTIECDKLDQLLDLIDKKHASDYHDWWKIGCAIKNVCNNYEVFDKFSKKCPEKYNEAENLAIWDTIPHDKYPYQREYLISLAKKSSNAIIVGRCLIGGQDEVNFYKNLSGEGFMAKYIFETTCDIVAGSPKPRSCYVYDPKDGIWKLRNSQTFIMHQLDDFRDNLFAKLSLSKKSQTEIKSCLDDFESVSPIGVIIKKLIEKLIDGRYRESVAKEFWHYIQDNNIEDKLDKRRNIVNFNGRIAELFQNRIIIRNPEPFDYISQSSTVQLRTLEEIMASDKMRDEYLNDFMPKQMQIFGTLDKLNYYYWKCGSALFGCLDNKRLLFSMGNTSNGKTTLTSMFLKLIFPGNFYSENSPKFLSEAARAGGSAEGPSPMTASLELARLLVINDSGGKATSRLDEYTLKTHTSAGDYISARRCHSNDIVRFKPDYLIIYNVNEAPEIPYSDAVDRRIDWLHFDAYFTEKPEELGEPRTYLIDETFKERIPKHAEYFLALLIDITQKMLSGIFDKKMIPADSHKFKRLYAKMAKGPIEQFIDEKCCKSHKSSISVDDFHEVFILWCRSSDTHKSEVSKYRSKSTVMTKLYLLYTSKFDSENGILNGYKFIEE
jgi:hypothetical protein